MYAIFAEYMTQNGVLESLGQKENAWSLSRLFKPILCK